MSQTVLVTSGYVCAPYMHNHESIELKEAWSRSKNIESMHFVTATFSYDSKPYFSSSTNHYILARFKDDKKIEKEIEKFKQDKTSFVFSMNDDLFKREANGKMNFVSVYYLEYGDTHEDFSEVANVVAKRDKVGRAGIGRMDTYSTESPKFTFPYNDHIVVLEVSSEKSHQSVNKYCEKTRSDVNRKGLSMYNLMSLSILEKIK